MATSQSTKSLNASAVSFSRTAIRQYVGKRWFLLAVGGLVLVAIAAISWSWLVAAGIASVLLSVLPCLVMCGLGLGLCMHKFVGGRARPQATGSAAVDGSAVSAQATAPDSSAIYASSCCAGALHGTSANTLAENATTESKEKTHA
jgi:hypothetical protein